MKKARGQSTASDQPTGKTPKVRKREPVVREPGEQPLPMCLDGAEVEGKSVTDKAKKEKGEGRKRLSPQAAAERAKALRLAADLEVDREEGGRRRAWAFAGDVTGDGDIEEVLGRARGGRRIRGHSF